MLKSPFKFLGFKRQAKTPNPSPQNERKRKGSGKLRKVRHSANIPASVSIADRPSIPEKDIVTEGKHSGELEHYQNQVRTSVSSACNRIRTMYSPRVHRSSAHPIFTILIPSVHFHRTHKPMKTTIYLLRYLQIPVETLQVARNLEPKRPSPVLNESDYGPLRHLFAETRFKLARNILFILMNGTVITEACKIGLTMDQVTFRNALWLPKPQHSM